MREALPTRALLGTQISICDYAAAEEFVLDAVKAHRSCRITALDAHGLSRSAHDPAFRAVVNSFDLVTPDGHSLKWGLNLLYHARLRDRVAGPDLVLRLCARLSAEGGAIYAYGSHDHVVRDFVRNLSGRFPALSVAGFRPSRFRPATPEEDEEDVTAIRESGAELVLVGLGCPLQESWTHEHADRLGVPCVCVGAAFDFISGNKKRAPRWMQKIGVEWVYRICSEPGRLARRSIPAVAYVLYGLLLQKLRSPGERV